MTETRLFDPAEPPEWLNSDWWANTENCNHLDNRVHRARLESAALSATQAAQDLGIETITDVGAGDGGLLSLLPEPYRSKSWGYDVIEDSVKHAKTVRKVDVRKCNVVTGRPRLAPVVVATEMLEHIEDPHAFVQKLYNAGTEFLIASSPHSETAEQHEWNHAWAWDRPGYAALIEQAGFRIVGHFDAEWSQIIVGKR